MAKPDAAWSGSWTALEFAEGPPPRMSTCLEAIGTHLYLFGGEASAHSSIPVDSHLWRVDTSTTNPVWEKVVVEGTLPCARVAAASAIVGTCMYVFGGTYISEDGKETYLDDLWFFDTEKSTWSQAEKKGSFWPVGRNYHQMVAAGSDLFAFGGCDEPGRINDVIHFDTTVGEWQELAPVNKEAEGCPSGRGGASLVAISNELLIVMFGYNGKQNGDIYGFDVKTKAWRPLEHTGTVPPDRSVTQPRMIKPGVLFLFGGERDADGPVEEGKGDYFSDSYVAEFKDGSFVWSLAQAWQDGPKARGWFASAVVADTSFYIFGGQDANGFCADLMRWSFEKGKQI